MNVMEQIHKEQERLDLPAFRSGDTVKVHVRIVEGLAKGYRFSRGQ